MRRKIENDSPKEIIKEMLNEMVRINIDENNGEFPYNKYEISVHSNDHEPAHFHIITSEFDIKFYISTGEVFEKSAEKVEIGKKLEPKVKRWLKQKSASEPEISNKKVCMLAWRMTHPD